VSSNHKAPLAAFVVVALACVVVLATNSMRSYARDAWRQFAAPVVSGLTLVPHPDASSSTTPVAHDAAATPDTTVDTTADAKSPANATPAVAVTTTKRASHHRHRHHPAKSTPASTTTPAPPSVPPATPKPPAVPAWPSHGPSHINHSSWPATVHQPGWPASNTHPAANQGNHFGQNKQFAGNKHGQSNQGWQGMAPGKGLAKGLHKSANTPYAAADKLPQSSHRGFGFSSGHGHRTSFGGYGH
jgi:hypothetical protein